MNVFIAPKHRGRRHRGGRMYKNVVVSLYSKDNHLYYDLKRIGKLVARFNARGFVIVVNEFQYFLSDVPMRKKMRKQRKFTRLCWNALIVLITLMAILPEKAMLQARRSAVDIPSQWDVFYRSGNPKMESVLNQLMEVYTKKQIKQY